MHRPQVAVLAKPLLVFFIILSTENGLVASKKYTVVSNGSSSSCTGDRTQCSLMYYATHPDQYFREDNTTFFFLSGHHRLVNSTVVLMANVSNLTLYGTNMSEVSVVCDGEDSGGFQFYNITNLSIRELSVWNCSARCLFQSQEFFQLPAVYMREAINIKMERVSIQNTTGQGLSLSNVYGYNTFDSITVKHSHKSNIIGGLNFYFFCQEHVIESENSIVISESFFEHGDSHQSNCSGVLMEVLCSNNISIMFNNVVIAGNSGGNIWIYLRSLSSLWTISISLFNCIIHNGTSNSGGGLSLDAITGINNKLSLLPLENCTHSLLHIENTIFKNNTAYHAGGAVYLRLKENTQKQVGSITFRNCTFQQNKIHHTANHGGVAVHVVTFLLPRYIQRNILFYYETSISDCVFLENVAQSSNNHYSASPPRTGVIYTENTQSVTIEDCQVINNNCSGIVGISSNFLMHGKNEISGNRAVKGGGIFLCASSMMHLYNGTILNISKNHANLSGGGIYVDGECSPAVEFCFFQVDNITADNATLSLTQVHLINNTAYAGSALFGGNIDRCILLHENRYHPTPGYIFNETFHFQHKTNDLSVISSDPEFVWFCEVNSTTTDLKALNCFLNITRSVKPGQKIMVPAVIVGQRHGLVSGVVVADCTNCSILLQEYSQYINITNGTNTKLYYTIFSSESKNISLKLVAEDYYSGFPTFQYTPSHINVRVERCPLGFFHSGKACSCLLRDISCNIAEQTVHRSYPKWIGYYDKSFISNSKAIILHPYCPQGHCVNSDVDIHSTTHHFYQDVQCAPNRTGLLCGRCKQNYSLGFGSSQCLSGCGTTHKYLQYLRVIGLTAVCGVAGILLVVLLTLLNLTVAEGTLNGLIFYANIVQVNVDIFYPSDTRSRPWTAFIAWLNLDFGVTVCFYDGMDAYIKTWLQFIFPLYLWMLSGAIVYFSRKSRRIAKLAGRNAVKVLATLFLLSFGKLIRTVIAAGLFTNIKSYDGTINISVWLPDANVHYIHGKHVVLFAFSSLAVVVALLYALILTFIQCLRRSPNSRIDGWVVRLKPLLDAYTGPYKNKYHFWTGFLLLVRITLFSAFACNLNNNPSISLTLTITAASLLMLGILKGIYRNRAIKLLEGSMYTNLVLFSVFTMLVMKKSSGEKLAVVCVFSTWVLLTLAGVIVYHAYKYCCGDWIRHHLRLLFESRLRLNNARSITAVRPLIIAQKDDSSECSNDDEKEREMNDQVWATPNLRESLLWSSNR